MLGLDIYEADLCDGCGLPTIIRQDPSNLFRIVHAVCPTCAQLAPAGRVQAVSDEEAVKALGEKPPPTTPLPTDGRTTQLRRLPDEEPEATKPLPKPE